MIECIDKLWCVLFIGASPVAQCRRRRRCGLDPHSGRSSKGGHGNPLQCSCLENPHGHRSLVCYSPWGRKESDTTEATEHAGTIHRIKYYMK